MSPTLILPGQFEVICQPDILIFEGLNVLQVPTGATVTASDFFDLPVYLDAAETDIERWFLERLLRWLGLPEQLPGFR